MNILITSSGRRVSLVKSFKKFLRSQNENFKVFTADMKENAPTAFFSDKHLIVPRVTSEDYIPKLLEISHQENIDVIIPTIDTELEVLSKNKKKFLDEEIHIWISDPEVCEIFANKFKTSLFFSDNSFKIAENINLDNLWHDSKNIKWPLFIKPVNGSRSVGAFKVHNIDELKSHFALNPDIIVQSFIEGIEYTVDVYVTCESKIKSIVPRRRIEVRDGEVSKGITEKNFNIIKEVKRLMEIPIGFKGVITVQCFLTKKGEVIFNEINPRFGGGAPLSIQAGANYPLWIFQELNGNLNSEYFEGWEDGLQMVRYDQEIFMSSKK